MERLDLPCWAGITPNPAKSARAAVLQGVHGGGARGGGAMAHSSDTLGRSEGRVREPAEGRCPQIVSKYLCAGQKPRGKPDGSAIYPPPPPHPPKNLPYWAAATQGSGIHPASWGWPTVAGVSRRVFVQSPIPVQGTSPPPFAASPSWGFPILTRTVQGVDSKAILFRLPDPSIFFLAGKWPRQCSIISGGFFRSGRLPRENTSDPRPAGLIRVLINRKDTA